MNDSFKTLLAFVGGVAAGAVFGILLAPDKGSETRKKILSRAKDLSDDLTDAAKTKYDDFLNWKDEMIEDAGSEVKKTVNNYADKANQLADKAENKIKNAHV